MYPLISNTFFLPPHIDKHPLFHGQLTVYLYSICAKNEGKLSFTDNTLPLLLFFCYITFDHTHKLTDYTDYQVDVCDFTFTLLFFQCEWFGDVFWQKLI